MSKKVDFFLVILYNLILGYFLYICSFSILNILCEDLKKMKSKKIILIFLAFIIVIIAILGVIFVWYNNSLKPVESSETTEDPGHYRKQL